MGAARLLDLYGLDLIAHPGEFADVIRAVDQGNMSQDDFAAWLDDHCLPIEERDRSDLGPDRSETG